MNESYSYNEFNFEQEPLILSLPEISNEPYNSQAPIKNIINDIGSETTGEYIPNSLYRSPIKPDKYLSKDLYKDSFKFEPINGYSPNENNYIKNKFYTGERKFGEITALSSFLGAVALSGLIETDDPIGSSLIGIDTALFDVAESNRKRNEQARTFRRERLRAGPLGELIDSIPTDPVLRQNIAPFLENRAVLTSGTYLTGETHRDLAALFGGLMTTSPEIRDRTIDAIDATAKQESDQLKAEISARDEFKADVIIVGAGIHGSVMAAKIRAERPQARVITIDKDHVLGGQFRKYGKRPVFFLNSRNHRPQDNAVPGLPDGSGNLNGLGNNAALQVTDISADTYPTNLELGHAAAINQYLSAETLLDSKVLSIRSDGSLTALDSITGKEYTLFSDNIVIASGLGERSEETDTPDNLWTAEKLFRHFGNAENTFPMQEFIGKRVAIVGGGDTGRVCAELFARLAPGASYGRSVTQLGGPRNINWFGTEFADRDEFCESNRPRYQRLASFIGEIDGVSSAFVIKPRKERVQSIEPDESTGLLSIFEEDGQEFGGFDIIIDARSLPEPIESAQRLTGKTNVAPVIGTVRGTRVEVGKQLFSRGSVYLVGPAAKTKLSTDEQRRFAEGISENTVSIWANAPRTEALASLICERLGPMESGTTSFFSPNREKIFLGDISLYGNDKKTNRLTQFQVSDKKLNNFSNDPRLS